MGSKSLDTDTNPKGYTMIAFKIETAYSETSTGRIIKVYNVTDAKDGYIFDTFNLKRDAKAYVDRSEALQQNKG